MREMEPSLWFICRIKKGETGWICSSEGEIKGTNKLKDLVWEILEEQPLLSQIQYDNIIIITIILGAYDSD
jgi:hypothetical protein